MWGFGCSKRKARRWLNDNQPISTAFPLPIAVFTDQKGALLLTPPPFLPPSAFARCELEIVVNSMLNSTRQVQTYFLLTMHLLIALRNEAEART